MKNNIVFVSLITLAIPVLIMISHSGYGQHTPEHNRAKAKKVNSTQGGRSVPTSPVKASPAVIQEVDIISEPSRAIKKVATDIENPIQNRTAKPNGISESGGDIVKALDEQQKLDSTQSTGQPSKVEAAPQSVTKALQSTRVTPNALSEEKEEKVQPEK